MAPLSVKINFHPKAHQLAVLTDTRRHRGVVMHRRAGKTVTAIFDNLKAMLECRYHEPRVAYIAPYQKQAKQLAWDYLVSAVSGESAKPYFKVHQQDLSVTCLYNSSKFKLLGADNIDSIRGMYFDQVVVDELADCDPRLWTAVLRPALADRKGRALLMGTPKGRMNMLYELSKVKPDDPEWGYHCYNALQTGMVRRSELAALQREMSDALYQQEFMCSFNAALLGAIYGKEMNNLQAAGRFLPFDHDPAYPVYTSWDLGWADATSVVYWQIIGGEIRLIDYDEFTLTKLPDSIRAVLSKPYQYIDGSHYGPHDLEVHELGSGRSRLEIAREHGIDFVKVPNWSLEDGIEAVRSLLPRVYISSTKCERLLECFVNYVFEFDESARTFKTRPKHDWTSHAMDAVRMFAVGHAGGMGHNLKRAQAAAQQWLF